MAKINTLALKELAEVSKVSELTLSNWQKTKSQTFNLIMVGAMMKANIIGEIDLHESPAKACKQYGLKSLKELSSYSGQSTQTLTNWFSNKPVAFSLLLVGVVIEKTFNS